jgi:hypothetical protein
MKPMRNAAWLTVVLATLGSVAGGCTTVLYKGPRRPDSEIAALISRDTMVVRVDKLEVREKGQGNYSRFEVLPGYHQVAISLNQVTPGVFTTNVKRSAPIVVCVELEAGHLYQTQARINGDRWVPEIVDQSTQRPIDPFCDAEDDAPATSGKPAATPKPPVPVRPVAVASPDAAAPRAGTDPLPPRAAAVAAHDDGTPAAGAAPPAAGAATAAAPAAPRAVDVETPHASKHAVPGEADPDVAAAESGRRPGSGLTLLLGFGFGGTDFVEASSSNGNSETLSAGTGVIVGLGGMLTPLWPSENVGLGVGVEGSLKYDSISASNGSASITRYPLALTAHLLTNGSGGPNYFLVKGGVIRDFGVNYSASGFAALNADVTGTWGPTGSLGYYRRSNDVLAWDLLLFFAITDHVAGTEHVSANSFGLTTALHFNL